MRSAPQRPGAVRTAGHREHLNPAHRRSPARRPRPQAGMAVSSATGADPAAVDRLWQAFLRRFDLEHTFRLFKQALGWTVPKVRDPAAADRWTWLVIACHAQLRPPRPPPPDPPPPR